MNKFKFFPAIALFTVFTMFLAPSLPSSPSMEELEGTLEITVADNTAGHDSQSKQQNG